MDILDTILVLAFLVPASLVTATGVLVIGYLFLIHVPVRCAVGIIELRASSRWWDHGAGKSLAIERLAWRGEQQCAYWRSDPDCLVHRDTPCP